MYEGEQVLNGKQILSGEAEGVFVGRLLRTKMSFKETKEGQLSVLALGFVNRSGELMRVNIVGKLALRENKQLKKGRVYCIRGL